MNAVVKTGAEIVDRDAIYIGDLYTQSASGLVNAIEMRLECGRRLAQKKASLPHGEWLPWLAENAGVLGFSERTTAQRLMVAARGNDALAHHLDEDTALALSRKIWGHPTNYKGQGTGENEWYTPPEIIECARLCPPSEEQRA